MNCLCVNHGAARLRRLHLQPEQTANDCADDDAHQQSEHDWPAICGLRLSGGEFGLSGGFGRDDGFEVGSFCGGGFVENRGRRSSFDLCLDFCFNEVLLNDCDYWNWDGNDWDWRDLARDSWRSDDRKWRDCRLG